MRLAPSRPPALAELVALVDSGTVTVASGKAVLAEMFATGDSAAAVVERRGVQVVDDADQVARLVRQVLDSHPEQLDQYLAGKTSIGQWFFGQVMRLAGGQANPARVQQCPAGCPAVGGEPSRWFVRDVT